MDTIQHDAQRTQNYKPKRANDSFRKKTIRSIHNHESSVQEALRRKTMNIAQGILTHDVLWEWKYWLGVISDGHDASDDPVPVTRL